MKPWTQARSSPPSSFTRFVVDRFCSGWIPELITSASARVAARASRLFGSSGGSGHRSSRYSRIAIDWRSSTRRPSSSMISRVGTCFIGLRCA
jgi:hypothetical protein